MKFAKLTIDGILYELSYSFNNFCDAEDEVRLSLVTAIERQGANNARQFRGLLYGMTRERHPELTLADCGRLIRIDSIPAITLAIGEACAIAVSEEFEEKWRAMLAEPANTNDQIASTE